MKKFTRRGFLKYVGLMITCLAVALVIAGCSGSNDSNSNSNSNSSVNDNSNSSGSSPVASHSKTVNIGLSENVTSLDPHDSKNRPGGLVMELCYQPLIERDGEFGTKACLAEDWTVSPDGLDWDFKLREGVTFHNGEPFNADDVLGTFKRLFDIYDTNSTLSTSFPTLKSFDDIEKVSDYEVIFHFSSPYALTELSFRKLFIIPNEAYEELGDRLFYDQLMYGTGPWVFDEWVDGQYVHFTKNEDFWNKDYDSYFDDLYLRTITEASTAVAAHLAGDLDMYLASGGISADLLPLYAGTEDTIDLTKLQTAYYMYAALSHKEESPFNDPKIRQALTYAIDYDSICQNILGGGVVPNSEINPYVVGNNPDIEPYEYNPEKAAELLAESSYASKYNNQEITVYSHSSTTHAEDVTVAISEMMNKVGFNTVPAVVEAATLTELRSRGDYDMFIVTTGITGGDMGSTLASFYTNDTHHTGHQYTDLSEAITAANQEPNAEKRVEMLQEIGVMIKDAIIHIPLCAMEQTEAINYGITGVNLYADSQWGIHYVDWDSSLVK